ncbi:hypothetical protein PoB_007556400 [Plakobranchus ocellatus]|uniref:Uncharacterized protein n=1 Tax=Plakobranchus ocellatus TaxID=259542 RepID=A0AAV4DXY0_9GAST|nr:hypothetical protein PoB_007556400 [Plakobranchus ocellatus]
MKCFLFNAPISQVYPRTSIQKNTIFEKVNMCQGVSMYLSLLFGCVTQECVLRVLLVEDQVRHGGSWYAVAKAAGTTVIVKKEAESFMFEVNKCFRGLTTQGVGIEMCLVSG